MNSTTSPYLAVSSRLRMLLKWPLRQVDKGLKQLTLATDGQLLCRLFNLRARLRGQSVWFSHDAESGRYLASDDGKMRYFYAKFQNIRSYQNGIAARGQELGDSYFLPLIDFAPGDTVVDCGANVGDLKLWFDEAGLDINYIGFEPSPKEHECLIQNVTPHSAHNMGLWNEDSSLQLFVSSRNADSSFFQPETFTETCTIPTKRLDEFINQPIRLLKLEAEGAEPEVLQGCMRLLNRIDYISADLGFERGPAQESTFAPVTNFLLSNGFEMIAFGEGRVMALYRNTKIKNQSL